jgi:sigma-B regulation protein RsbU (phosphoserine phosphatase)
MKRLRDELREAYSRLEADNTRKTEELETARTIQQGFLPVSIPQLPYLEIAAFQKPATEVGGDYYDFFPQADSSGVSMTHPGYGNLVVAIGDATGHGVGASLMVSATKMALMTIDEPDLTEKMCQINMYLKRINSYRLLNMALTLVELQYDDSSVTVRARAVGGGMPPLIVLRSDGVVEEVAVEGLPPGAVETAEYESTEFQMGKSDLLILMSDGLPERINDKGELLGYARIRAETQKAGQTTQSARGVLEALMRKSDDWSHHTPQDDDVTIVVLRVR